MRRSSLSWQHFDSPPEVIAIQTFGDVPGFNPHCHILVTDGCFSAEGMFRVAPPLELKKPEAMFRHKVLCMLIAKGRISREMIAMLATDDACPTDFPVNAAYGDPVYPWEAYVK